MAYQDEEEQKAIKTGNTSLGIELGTTRIKAVLIGPDHAPLATGAFAWENQYENAIWTYHLEDVWSGLQSCYRNLQENVQTTYQVPLEKIGAVGVSAMMHGYMAFDQQDELLVPFRTWRNTITGQAAAALTDLFQFNIPQRWSIAHLYQAILNGEPHVQEISYLTTLAGYIHWQLTGEKVLGIGDASGMFPIDSTTHTYDEKLLGLFNAKLAEVGITWRLEDVLPKVLIAGEQAGALTAAGAVMLDPSGTLQPGVPFCPPEGDAGTGMVATNSVLERTGNVSAGTSVFAMIVMEEPLSKVYPEIDIVTTPAGRPVAMVHSNNCTSDLNEWVGLFGEFAEAVGVQLDPTKLFGTLYKKALSADADTGGLLAYNTVSGEHITRLETGCPLFVRAPESTFTLANFMRTHLYAALAALRIGLDILFEQEGVEVDTILGHGGFFKTAEVGQRMMAAAFDAPVAVMETAGEGGPWGMAILAAYLTRKSADQPLEDYLAECVFVDQKETVFSPDSADVAGFKAFMGRYKQGLVIERTAGEVLG
ncbi:FGGY-family carbohydrate kinase [bacterium]|nr:FGGY-family carbohydrate kinase [bacterium]